ncbi:hypothetical protein FIBSPDRAFT_1054587 [Athelia psychrophila]|uniref:Uncharacterized protein n=1 Tax=Athelia psychrophila TaxID=1759441 RepID=A0A167V2S5_9AGAM|nr:hypothetical protein FIBSPDRAFT_1054587 [Fibularhizoctonia sp. CBS 109695]
MSSLRLTMEFTQPISLRTSLKSSLLTELGWNMLAAQDTSHATSSDKAVKLDEVSCPERLVDIAKRYVNLKHTHSPRLPTACSTRARARLPSLLPHTWRCASAPPHRVFRSRLAHMWNRQRMLGRLWTVELDIRIEGGPPDYVSFLAVLRRCTFD